jgi:type VI secretion system protein ImpA
LIVLETLLTAVSQDSPCGPNLEYDPDFVDLEAASVGKPERFSSGETIPAIPPEWPDVKQRAEALLGRTKDVRVAVVLCRALTCTGGFAGLAEGLTFTHQLLSRFWEGAYPALEGEDKDPTTRLNALDALVDADALPRDVKDLYVATVAGGRISVRDILVTQKKLQPVAGTAMVTPEAVQGLIRDAAAANAPPPLEAMEKSLNALSAFDTLLSEKVGATKTLNLQEVKEALTVVLLVCRKALGIAEKPQPGDPAATDPATIEAANHGEIRRREDAVRQLDRVCDFIQATEPGHPAPLLIRRAQRLMAKSFLDIIQDLAPESLGQIQKIAGLDKK